MEYFQYGEKELSYLKSRDSKLAEAIEQIGHIDREIHPGLFSALVNSIVGQQISTKAQITVWNRILEVIGDVTPKRILDCPDEKLQACGLSYRKVGYIKSAATKIQNGELDLNALSSLTDEEICQELVKLPGIGVWTAQMLMIFSMQRPDIVSFGDLGILRGMRCLYHHQEITPKLFARYRKRYSPYGTVASLYLWAIAAGAVIDRNKEATPPPDKEKKPMKYYQIYPSPIGALTLTADEDSLLSLSFGEQDEPEALREETPLLALAARQLQEYFAGTRKEFDLPLKPEGTPFQKRVWEALCAIPYGETRSYKDIAILAGSPKGYRAVGMANNKNPIAIIIPCHRVIGADGRLVGYGGGMDIKIALLTLEQA